MAKAVIMPKFGMTMEEGTIIRWYKEEGDRIEKGEPLLEVMTDKVNMDVEAPASGVLRGVRAFPDDVIPVTQIIAYIAAPGEEVEATSASSVEPIEAAPPPAEAVKVERPPREGKVPATPAARRLAKEHGIDLAAIEGSGAGGRIVKADVKALIEKAKEEAPPLEEVEIIPLTGMRKIIAQRMQKSVQEAPHIALTVEVDMSRAEELQEQLRGSLAQETGGLSMTAILVKVVASALKRHPLLNATLQGEEIRLLRQINVGMAVALEEGLIVPVIRDADQKGLAEIAASVNDLAQRAREGKLTPDEVMEGTFTLSNLGMLGVDEFTAIINPPQSAILAVGRIAKRPVVIDDEVVIRPMMRMTLSADHRILDGAAGARFLQDVKTVLENPYLLFT